METNRRDIIMSFAIKEIYVEYQKAPLAWMRNVLVFHGSFLP